MPFGGWHAPRRGAWGRSGASPGEGSGISTRLPFRGSSCERPGVIAGIRIKVCGLRSLVDAAAADEIGADHLGFILWPGSPRFVPPGQWNAMAPRLPARPKVAVSVLPTPDDLRLWSDAGFDLFQVHFPLETTPETVAAWARSVGRERLRLAPKLPPGAAFPEALLEHATGVLFDAYSKDGFGGSGLTGDWTAFRRLRERHPGHEWVLAGGLGPENIAAALAATGARFVDVNSGVEAAPGVKDPAKLRAFAAAVRRNP